jgi:hypothetical protein
VAPTGKIGTWGLVHIKDHIKLQILTRGWLISMRSDRVGAGKCVKISKLWDISAHGSTHRPAMDMGVAANERGRQTTYSIRRWTFLNVIWWS